MRIDKGAEWNEVGRCLGYDLYRFGRDLRDPRTSAAIDEGYRDAAARRIERRAPDRHERKWLQLRVNAFRRDRIVDVGVTPSFLRSIDVETCPVLRITLTHGLGEATDWSVDRLNNDGAYARSNLAVMSTAANRAKGSKRFDDVLRLALAPAATDGPAPGEWLRLASLMLGPAYAATPALAPLVPLVAPLPNNTVRPVFQIVQHVFTVSAGSLRGWNALRRDFGRICPDARATDALGAFGDALHRALKTASPCWDAWLEPRVVATFRAWRQAMSPERWGMAGHLASRLGHAEAIGPERVRAWSLASSGYHH